MKEGPLRPGAHAVVLGTSSKIGMAIADALAAEGATVTGLSRSSIQRASIARAIRCDATSPSSIDEALAEAAERQSIDVLVYSAGAPAMGATTSVPDDVARESFEVNFWGLERSVRALLPAMAARRSGAIVAVLSLAAIRAVPFEAYYAAAKAASCRFLECVAHEAARDGVIVDYVAPGFIDTGFYSRGGWFGMETPAVRGSGIEPADVGHAVVQRIHGRGHGRVLGWREKTIVLADRLAPGLYDRWLRR